MNFGSPNFGTLIKNLSQKGPLEQKLAEPRSYTFPVNQKCWFRVKLGI